MIEEESMQYISDVLIFLSNKKSNLVIDFRRGGFEFSRAVLIEFEVCWTCLFNIIIGSSFSLYDRWNSNKENQLLAPGLK